jgi:hypothetical protein
MHAIFVTELLYPQWVADAPKTGFLASKECMTKKEKREAPERGAGNTAC